MKQAAYSGKDLYFSCSRRAGSAHGNSLSESIYRIFRAAAEKYPARICLDSPAGQFSYAQVGARIAAIASFLQNDLAVKPGEAVAVFADFFADWLPVNLAIQAIGAVEFPRATQITLADVRTLRQKTRCRVFFVADASLWQRVKSAAGNKAQVILLESPPQRNLPRNVTTLRHIGAAQNANFREFAHPIAAVILTSGTTGDAKWVPVQQRSFLHSMRVIPRILGLNERDVFLSCLPSWHLYARLVEYIAAGCGSRIVYCAIPDLADALKTSRCTIFPSFPEIWEQIYHRILDAIEQNPMRRLLRRFIDLVIHADRAYERWSGRVRHESKRAAFADIARLAYLLPMRWLLQRFVFRGVVRSVSPGLRYAIMGDAPLPLAVDETLRALGFQVLEGYGSTEQCVTALRRPARNFPGAVGRILPGVHVEIDANEELLWNGSRVGEIVVNGDNVFTGYFDTMQALGVTEGAAMHYATGDIGTVESGNLMVIGRKTNAFRLAGGEIIFPELVENVLRGSRYVGRVLVFGSGRRSTVALVVPDFAALLQWAENEGFVQPGSKLAAEPEMHPQFWQKLTYGPALALYRHEFATLLEASGLPSYAAPHACHILPRGFHRGAELTMTLKPRRRVIEQRYRRELQALYFK